MKIKATALILLSFLIFVFLACGTNRSGNTFNAKYQPLKNVYQDNFLIGNIITGRYMTGDYYDLLTTHFNIVTCENQMKPDHLGPREKGGQYNWAPADKMVSEMLSSGIKVHGHALVWHNQTHAWMTEGTPQQVRENMIKYINDILAHYKGKIFSWDVVNEAVLERINPGEQNHNWRTQLRSNSGWFKALGADFIELAFRTARQADPDVQLYYNDYNLNNQRKAVVVANMIKELNGKYRAEGNSRNLIDGVGLQAHYSLTVRIEDVRSTIQRFVDLGIKVDISELDVEIRSVGGNNMGARKDTPMNDVEQRQQALVYAQLFNLFKEFSGHIPRVTMWGMDDENSWKSFANPCLWDGDLRPKQAFFAVINPKRALGL